VSESTVDSKGHVWRTEREVYGYNSDDPATEEFPADPDDGFNSSGPCYGPICVRCGYHYCQACHPEGPPDACEPDSE